MKNFKISSFIFCLLTSIVGYILSFSISCYFYNTFNNPFIFVLPILNYIVIHDYICRDIICSIRKKYNMTDGCYFWICPHYSVCPYNSNK